jgi:deoxyribodipyrimidine photo-lyase
VVDIAIHWFRRDLRLEDNSALHAALTSDLPVLPVFIFDGQILAKLSQRHDRRVSFIHREVKRLKTECERLGGTVLTGFGNPVEVWANWIESLAADGFRISEVYVNRDYEPYAKERDAAVWELFKSHGIGFHGRKDQVILEKDEVLKDDGKPYTVFTPYSRKWHKVLQPADIASRPSEEHLNRLLSHAAPSMPTLAEMGFAEATDFEFPDRDIDLEILRGYADCRDLPAVKGTSRLSLHLRFGTISIRAAVRAGEAYSPKWLTELIWRDFYAMILHHFPGSATAAFKPAYDNIPWRNDPEAFAAWQAGKTGYPLVDAGMRELAATGFMHNRVRMVVASFLCKHLLLDWRLGERHFAEQLLDFDLASNVGGWQWAAGSGCDAAPYFRVFNPTSQQTKFDPDFRYIRRWVPEYGTPAYPSPIVDHKMARQRAIDTYKAALTPTA